MKKKPLVERAYIAARNAVVKADPKQNPRDWHEVGPPFKTGFRAFVRYVKAHVNER